MSLIILSPALILEIASHLNESSLNALIQTSRIFHFYLNTKLHRNNAQHHAGIGIFWTAISGEVGAVRKLLDAGAFPNPRTCNAFVERAKGYVARNRNPRVEMPRGRECVGLGLSARHEEVATMLWDAESCR